MIPPFKRKNRAFFLYLLLLLLPPYLLSAGDTLASLRVRAPETATRGEVIRILVEGMDIQEVTVDLRLPGSRDQVLYGFPVAAASTGQERWQVLGGVDHTVPGGDARLEITVGTSTGRRHYQRVITIRERPFLSEEILLNALLSDLRRTEDPLRDQESRELWDLLHQVNRGSRYHSGTFILPLEEFRRTSTFGDRRVFRYSDDQVATSRHYGLDMAAPRGTPVRASARGRVVMAMDRIITGGSVVLEHQPGIYSIYYHLDQVDVTAGTMAEQGDQLGTVGATGLATGPHLHWEVRIGGVAVDPELFLRVPLVDMSGIAGALSVVP
ncbi:MAG: M23 family metallopeptidase [Spirochaetaceae bacterium]|nr:MAG: M23 family metallopeptidase [Spirochaetaceae bacterium]